MSGKRLSALLKRDLVIDPVIEGVTADSRKVKPGYLFAALSGVKSDGREYVAAALAAGAVAVISETPVAADAPVIVVGDARRAYALAAANFWGAQPATCVAVTGTNGKTSVATFCRQMFERLGHSAASMGTLGVRAGAEQITPPGLTTPDAGDVAGLLADLAGRGVTHLALEASSHGIDQRRLDGVALTAAGFLNLTQDHLDYHGTMEAYRAAKLRLFEALTPRGATAVLNADSDAYAAFAAASVTSGLSIFSVGGDGRRADPRAPGADAGGPAPAHRHRRPQLRRPPAARRRLPGLERPGRGRPLHRRRREHRGRTGSAGAHRGRAWPTAARRRRQEGRRGLC